MTFEFQKIKSILACPLCRRDLVMDNDRLICTDPESRLSFPIVDDIPRLLVDESTQLSPDEWTEIMQRQGSSGWVVATMSGWHTIDVIMYSPV